MNYLEEKIDGEAMINSIQNGDQPLPVIALVSLSGTTHNATPTFKDPKFWIAEEKNTRKIDRIARSLLIQRLPNDIYSLIDSNETAKDLWDALERQMCGSEYGEQDRKAVILYAYKTFKTIEGEQLLDTYLHYLQVINDLKKCGYKKDNCELNYKFLNNLQPEWKQYGTLMRQTKNLMDININALYNILKQNQGDVNDALGYKKKVVVITSDLLALVAEKIKVSKRKEKVVVSSNSKGSGADDFSELKKITALLAKAFNRRKFYSKPTNNNLRTSSTSQFANKKQEFVKSDDTKADEKKRDMSKVKSKKDSDEQVLLAEDQAWMESSSDSDQEINANMVFMAQIEKVLSESDESSSSAEETIAKEKNNEFNDQIKVLNEKNADLLAQTEVLLDQLKIKHVVIDTHTECQAQYAKLEKERYEYMIRYSALYDSDKQHRKKIDEQEILFDKMSRQLVKMNNNVLRLQEKILEKETKISKLEGCIVQICLWIIDSGCSKHMTGNRALLTNFVEKFLGTVRFGNNDFAVIAGFGDVVI
nr:integrase, catalytic region, zinc finger, CCHC-type, peptidase aspartic, catalytic [Tanacetum cinerariifolium]